MVNESVVRDLANEKLQGSANYLVDVSVSRDNVISIEIDNDAGVSIDDCAELSRYVESRLGRDEEDFALKVGSSGVTSPFKTVRQYKKNIGNEVEMQLKGGARMTGVLKAAGDASATITVWKKARPAGSKRKVFVEEDLEFSYDEIEYTKYLLRF